jgi:hypothetical protein
MRFALMVLDIRGGDCFVAAPALHYRSLVSAFAAGLRSLGSLKPDIDEYGYF